jgi:hypothetical protein
MRISTIEQDLATALRAEILSTGGVDLSGAHVEAVITFFVFESSKSPFNYRLIVTHYLNSEAVAQYSRSFDERLQAEQAFEQEVIYRLLEGYTPVADGKNITLPSFSSREREKEAPEQIEHRKLQI